MSDNWIAEILIGDEVVWAALTSRTTRNLVIDVSRFTGPQNLRFRIRKIWNMSKELVFIY